MCFSVGVERNLSQLGKLFGAKIDAKAFHKITELSQANPKDFKVPGDDNRLYPHVFGPVITGVSTGGGFIKVIKPMRYRVRPHDASEEVPSKFNLFNARLDSLESRKTWRPLFGRNHGLFPYKRFYEWVDSPSGKRLVSFDSPQDELLMAPVLFDYFDNGEQSFFSFAIITTDPPQEVLEAGHDRCPIFIKKQYWDDWLKTYDYGRDDFYNMLKDPQPANYRVTSEQQPKKADDPQLDLFQE